MLPRPSSPAWRIPPGVIEDGIHYGYLYDYSDTGFSFDRVDVAADGTWTNVNPKLRALPTAGWPWTVSSRALHSGQAIGVSVENQVVTGAWIVDDGEYGECGC